VTAHRARQAPKPRQKWTRRQIEALGTRTDLPTAGSIIAGLSETSSRELWRRGEFPVPVLQVGRRLVVPTAPILELLGLGSGGSGIRSRAADWRPGGGGDRPGEPGEGPGDGEATGPTGDPAA
jgi:hypothetical protein